MTTGVADGDRQDVARRRQERRVEGPRVVGRHDLAEVGAEGRVDDPDGGAGLRRAGDLDEVHVQPANRRDHRRGRGDRVEDHGDRHRRPLAVRPDRDHAQVVAPLGEAGHAGPEGQVVADHRRHAGDGDLGGLVQHPLDDDLIGADHVADAGGEHQHAERRVDRGRHTAGDGAEVPQEPPRLAGGGQRQAGTDCRSLPTKRVWSRSATQTPVRSAWMSAMTGPGTDRARTDPTYPCEPCRSARPSWTA